MEIKIKNPLPNQSNLPQSKPFFEKGKKPAPNCRKVTSTQQKLINEILAKRVVNLSSYTLSCNETQLLQKTLTFCPTPTYSMTNEFHKDIDELKRKLILKEYFSKHSSDSESTDSDDNTTFKQTILQIRTARKDLLQVDLMNQS